MENVPSSETSFESLIDFPPTARTPEAPTVPIGPAFPGCLAITTKPQKSFPLLKLPPQLRNIIYEEIFISRDGIGSCIDWPYTNSVSQHSIFFAQRMRDHGFKDEKDVDDQGRLLPYRLFLQQARRHLGGSLQRTCSQIYSETSNMFFKFNEFIFKDPHTLACFLRDLGTNRPQITTLKVHFYGKRPYSSESPFTCPPGTTKDKAFVAALAYVLQMLPECTGLNHLEMKFTMFTKVKYARKVFYDTVTLANAMQVLVKQKVRVPLYTHRGVPLAPYQLFLNEGDHIFTVFDNHLQIVLDHGCWAEAVDGTFKPVKDMKAVCCFWQVSVCFFQEIPFEVSDGEESDEEGSNEE